MGGKRLVIEVVLALAVLLAWLNALAIRVYRFDFELFGDIADRGDHLAASGAHLAALAVLTLGLLPCFVFATPFWTKAVTAVAIGTQLAFLLVARYRASELPGDPTDETTWTGFRSALLSPGSWPLLALVVAAVVVGVRARSSRGPRSPQDP